MTSPVRLAPDVRAVPAVLAGGELSGLVTSPTGALNRYTDPEKRGFCAEVSFPSRVRILPAPSVDPRARLDCACLLMHGVVACRGSTVGPPGWGSPSRHCVVPLPQCAPTPIDAGSKISPTLPL